MAVTLTPAAVELVRRSLELARLDADTHGVRLRLVGSDVQPRFAESPREGDDIVETGGVRVFVDPAITALSAAVEVGVSDEHERLVVTPLG